MQIRFLSGTFATALTVATLALVAPCALQAQGAQAGSPAMAPAGTPAGAGDSMKPGGSADAMKAMMDAYSKAAQPGEQHKRLAVMAGKWKVTGKSWMGPGGATEFNSTTEASMMMGGRYLNETHKGSFMGQPFEGRGVEGYDNGAHEYFTTWFDNMGTGVMILRGTCDDPCKVLTETGDEVDPASGKKTTSKQVITFIDNDTYHTEMYMVGAGPGGQDLKVMDMTSKRVH